MTLGINHHLIAEILNSPNALTLVAQMQSILAEEKKKRLAFYNQTTEQEKAEFINGEIIIHSPVKKTHNAINLNLIKIIGTYVTEKNLGFVGFEKILIQCTRNDYEPDLCFFNKTIANTFKADQSLFPIPDLIIEILSKGTAKRDRGIKYKDYQNHGVKEYWIISPEKKTVEQYLLNKESKYELELKSNSGEIKASTIDQLAIPIKTIFDEQLTHEFVRGIYGK